VVLIVINCVLFIYDEIYIIGDAGKQM